MRVLSNFQHPLFDWKRSISWTRKSSWAMKLMTSSWISVPQLLYIIFICGLARRKTVRIFRGHFVKILHFSRENKVPPPMGSGGGGGFSISPSTYPHSNLHHFSIWFAIIGSEKTKVLVTKSTNRNHGLSRGVLCICLIQMSTQSRSRYRCIRHWLIYSLI